MCIAAATFCAAMHPASAQVGWGASGDANQLTINFSVSVPVSITQVNGAPYSGQESMQTVQTLSDGTHLTQTGSKGPLTYRDSFGRVRTEQPMFPNQHGGLSFSMVQVADPVAGYLYVIDSLNQVVHRMAARASGPSKANSPNPTSKTLPDGTEITAESLGTSTMLGVSVIGTRITTTYPAGSRLGNDRPVTATSESWTSPQLGVLISSANSQPGGNVTTVMMKDFSIAEPDSSLFTVPAGYKVVDETGGFTVKITKQN